MISKSGRWTSRISLTCALPRPIESETEPSRAQPCVFQQVLLQEESDAHRSLITMGLKDHTNSTY